MSDAKSRLDVLVNKRDSLAKDVSRMKGRLDIAEKDLFEVNQLCLDKNIDPKDLDATIDKLQKNLSTLLGGLEEKMLRVEKDIAPFTEENRA